MRMTKFKKLARKQHEKPPTNEMTAAVLDNKIFVFGGFTGGSDFAPKLKDILRYNTAYHTWKDDERWWREDSTMQLRRWVTCQKSVCNYCWKLWWGLSERNLLLLLCDLFCWVMSSFLFCVQIFPFKDLLLSNKLIELLIEKQTSIILSTIFINDKQFDSKIRIIIFHRWISSRFFTLELEKC